MKYILFKALQVISILTLGAASLGLVVVGITIQSGVFQEKIEANAVTLLEKTLGQKISINAIKGNLLTNIQFEGVEIQLDDKSLNKIKIQNIKAVYSLSGIHKIHQQWMPALKRIEITGLDLNVIRYDKKTWNVFSLLNSQPNSTAKFKQGLQLPFTGEILIKEISGQYIDHRGWGRVKLNSPFVEPFKNGRARLRIRQNDPLISIKLSAEFAHIDRPAHLSGKINIHNLDYSFNLYAPGLEMASWGNYTFDRPKYNFSRGTAIFYGKFWRQKPYLKGPVPFRYNFTADIKDTAMKFPFFPAISIDTTATLKLQNGRLNIQRFSGTTQDIAWSGNGILNYRKKDINLSLQSKLFDSPNVVGIIPALKNWTISGPAKTHLTIKGPLRSPVLKGVLNSPALSFFGFNTQQMEIQYKLANKDLSLILVKGLLFDGRLRGKASLDLSEKYPGLTASLMGTHMQYDSSIFKATSANITLSLSGKTNDYDVSFVLDDGNLRAYGQHLDEFLAKGRVKNFKHVALAPITARINGSQTPITITGTVSQNHRAFLTVAMTDVPFQTWESDKNPFHPVNGRLTANLSITKTLDHFLINGISTISDGRVLGQPFSSLDAQWTYQDQEIQFDTFRLANPNSVFVATGKVSTKSIDIVISPQTNVDLNEWQSLLIPYGQFGGQINLSGTLSGPFKQLQSNLKFNTNALSINAFHAKKITGHIKRHYDRISFLPLHVQDDRLDYKLQGEVQLAPVLSQTQYQLDITSQQTDLQKLVRHLQIAFKTGVELKTRKPTLKVSPPIKSLPKLAIENPFLSSSGGSIFRAGSQRSSLAHFQKLQATIAKQQHDNQTQIPISGMLTGRVSLHSQSQKWPKVSGAVRLDDLSIFRWQAKSTSVNIRAISSSLIELSLLAQNGVFGEWPYEKIFHKIQLSDTGDVVFKQNFITHNKNRYNDLIIGSVPLGHFYRRANAPINLHLNFPQETIGMLAMLWPSFTDLTSQGSASIHLNGSLKKPVIRKGVINLQKASVFYGSTQTRYQVNQSNITIRNNRITIPKTPLIFTASRPARLKKPKPNVFTFEGNIQLSQLDLINPKLLMLGLRFKSEPTSLTLINTPLYEGQADIGQLTLVGNYPIVFNKQAKQKINQQKQTTFEGGPLLKGVVTLENGNIVMPSLSDSKVLPSYRLNLSVNFKQNVVIEGSLLGNSILSDLANRLRIELKPTQTPLLISGTLNAPKIENSLTVDNGQGYLINRVFEVMRPEDQGRFLTRASDEIQNNTISFQTQPNPNNQELVLVPQFNLAAIAIIESTVTTNLNSSFLSETGRPVSAMLMIIDGPANDLASIRFEHYDLDRPQIRTANPVYRQTYRLQGRSSDIPDGSQDVEMSAFLQTLMPELSITNELSSSQTDQSQQLINQISENRLNLFFKSQVFRPIERRLTDETGLYDVQIDYNAGGAVLEGVGTKETALSSQIVQVNLVENLAHNLFLRVRTDLDFTNREQVNTFQLSEIELTYYIMRNLSLNYANINEVDDTSAGFRPRASLKYSYEF